MMHDIRGKRKKPSATCIKGQNIGLPQICGFPLVKNEIVL